MFRSVRGHIWTRNSMVIDPNGYQFGLKLDNLEGNKESPNIVLVMVSNMYARDSLRTGF